jgi:hypothetical protein
MGYMDLVSIGSFVGLFAGILLVVIGLYSRRGGGSATARARRFSRALRRSWAWPSSDWD